MLFSLASPGANIKSTSQPGHPTFKLGLGEGGHLPEDAGDDTGGQQNHAHLLLELSQAGWCLGDGVVRLHVQLLGGGSVSKDEEVLHKLLKVIHPEVGVPLKGVLVLLSHLHGPND